MEIISTHSHNLVIDSETKVPILSDDGKQVLVSRISDDTLQWCPREAVEKVFGRINISSMIPHQSTNMSCQMSSTNIQDFETPSTSKDTQEQRRVNWTRSDILRLIQVYKDHYHLFKSQTMRHEKIWNIICRNMDGFTAEQVKNKFKYLKSRYIKKVENMSEKATGQEKCVFEYFEEFHEIFGNDPNITPVTTSASLRKRKLSETETGQSNSSVLEADDSQEEQTAVVANKQAAKTSKGENKKNDLKLVSQVQKMTEEIKNLREDLANSEKNREKRHAENLSQKQEATGAFKEYIDFLKNKKSISF